MLKIWNRPLSPHLTIYTSQLTSLYSILHRVTGVILIFFLLSALIICKISSCAILSVNTIYFYFYVNLWIKNCIFLNFMLILFYHLINGLRHISWDLGFNLPISIVLNSAKINAFILLIFIIAILQNITK